MPSPDAPGAQPAPPVQLACFEGAAGVRECHVLVRPAAAGSFDAQLGRLAADYNAALAAHGFRPGTAVFRRFFCSDLAARQAALADFPVSSRTAPDEPCAVSWVEQPPMPPADVALWAYHVDDPSAALVKRLDGPTLALSRGDLVHLWTTGLARPELGTAAEQTRSVFDDYAGRLAERGLSLGRHTLRTWLFLREIDADYGDVAAARRVLFADRGLTPDTHFIASTGIQGRGVPPAARVVLDAYAVGGIDARQVAYLSAPEHLGPTHHYGVTFERGTQITYRDRQHLVVSGTASIDPQGNILHPHDVLLQLGRTLDNIAALLRSAGASLDDLAVVLAYVRRPADLRPVAAALRPRCRAPVGVVVAPICRPGWLVEVEAWGVRAVSRPDLPCF